MKKQPCKSCGKPIGGRRLRGCCSYCYGRLRAAINAGKTTDEKLTRSGRWLESNRTGRPVTNPVSKEFGS